MTKVLKSELLGVNHSEISGEIDCFVCLFFFFFLGHFLAFKKLWTTSEDF